MLCMERQRSSKAAAWPGIRLNYSQLATHSSTWPLLLLPPPPLLLL